MVARWSVRMRVVVSWLSFCLVLLAGCLADERAPTRSCEPSAKSYDAIERGAELCEREHLVAALSPTRLDGTAGPGAIHVKLRILHEESRDYCFGDDNGEHHVLSVKSSDGTERVRLVAGDGCVASTLPAGLYDVRVEHAHVGVNDPTPDTIYTRLQDVSGRPTFVVQSNGCPGCDLRSLEIWPCQIDPTGAQVCGYQGDFSKALIGGKCRHVLLPENAVCTLDGTFDQADFTAAVVGEPPNLLPPDSGVHPVNELVSLRLAGSFALAAFPPRLEQQDTLDVILELTGALSGSAPDMSRWSIHSSSVDVTVDHQYLVQLNRASSFVGAPLLYNARVGLAGAMLDFDRVDIQPRTNGGPVSFDNLDFRGSTLKHKKSTGNAVSYFRTYFDHAVIQDSVFAPSDMSATSFNSATLRNVVFAKNPEGIIPAVTTDFTYVTLTNVRFGDSAIVATGVAFAFDFSSNQFIDATLDSVQFTNVDLRDASWRGSSVNALRALGSDLTNTSFDDVTKLSALDVSYSTFAPNRIRIAGSGSAVILENMTARGASIAGNFADYTSRNGSYIQATLDGTFTNAQFSSCNFDRAVLCSANDCVGFDGASFSRKTTLNQTYFLGSAMGAKFADVSAFGAVFRANMASSTFTDVSLNGSHFCLPNRSSASPYAAMTFTGATTLADVVFPITGTTVPPPSGQSTEVGCDGAITSVERDNLGTANVLRCPNGLPPAPNSDCRGADWDVPISPNPVCCVQKRGDNTCIRHNQGYPCTSPCQCASLKCSAATCE
jgi:uncharacterized protein YjbI with pentapeptide repeats